MTEYEYRSGLGFDIHRFSTENSKTHVVLGGVSIPHTRSLDGHSDADVVVHAIMDALLGAIGAGDIGLMFPATDDQYKGISSLKLLEKVLSRLSNANAKIVNIDVCILAEVPKLSPHYFHMISNIAKILKIDPNRVNIKSTTLEQLGDLGRGQGIAAWAVASVALPSIQPSIEIKPPPNKSRSKKVNPEIEKLKPLGSDLFKITMGSDDDLKVPRLLKPKTTKSHIHDSFSMYDQTSLNKAVEILKESEHIHIFCDGGSRGNPGNSGIGVVLCNAQNQPVCGLHKNLGVMTNNQAEYNGLLWALQILVENKLTNIPITVFMDSELVIKQITGIYRIQNEQLIELFGNVRSLLLKFYKYRFQHIPREQNRIADQLANQAMDEIER